MVEIITGILGLLVSIIGFYVKRAYAEMDAIRKELTDHRVEDVAKYLPRTEMNDFADRIRMDMQQMMNPISSKLQSIEEHLRGKHRMD